MASAPVISLGSSTLTVSSAQLCLLSLRLCPARRAGGEKRRLLAFLQNVGAGANLLGAALHFKAQVWSSQKWFAHLTVAKMA